MVTKKHLLDNIALYAEALGILSENSNMYSKDDYRKYVDRILEGLNRDINLLINNESSK